MGRAAGVVIDQEVDALVRRLARAGEREFRPPDEVPDFLRVGEPNEVGWYRWKIEPVGSAPWVPSLQAAFPVRLPAAFESLLRRYAFPALDLPAMTLFANTGRDGPTEMRVALGKDPLLSTVLASAGLVRFARARGGRYDPVCFDTRQRTAGGDFQVVLVDHEQALINERAVVKAVLAPSLRAAVTGGRAFVSSI